MAALEQQLTQQLAEMFSKQNEIIQKQETALNNSLEIIKQLQARISTMDAILAEQLVCQMDILNNQFSQDEVQAQILLNQMEAMASV